MLVEKEKKTMSTASWKWKVSMLHAQFQQGEDEGQINHRF